MYRIKSCIYIYHLPSSQLFPITLEFSVAITSKCFVHLRFGSECKTIWIIYWVLFLLSLDHRTFKNMKEVSFVFQSSYSFYFVSIFFLLFQGIVQRNALFLWSFDLLFPTKNVLVFFLFPLTEIQFMNEICFLIDWVMSPTMTVVRFVFQTPSTFIHTCTKHTHLHMHMKLFNQPPKIVFVFSVENFAIIARLSKCGIKSNIEEYPHNKHSTQISKHTDTLLHTIFLIFCRYFRSFY